MNPPQAGALQTHTTLDLWEGGDYVAGTAGVRCALQKAGEKIVPVMRLSRRHPSAILREMQNERVQPIGGHRVRAI